MELEESGAEPVVGEAAPIQNILGMLATDRRLPVLAVLRCLFRIGEAGPTLRGVLERAAGGERLSDDEARLLRRGLYILGGARDTEACRPLLCLLRLPEGDLDELLGHAFIEGMARVLASVFDGDAEALFALIADRSVSSIARDGVLNAGIILTWNGSIARDRIVRFLEHFDADKLGGDREQLWESWMLAVALLGLRDLAPLVHCGFADGRISEWLMARGEFDALLARAEQEPDDASRLKEFNLGEIEDVVDELSSRDHGLNLWGPPEPVRNPWRDVGRNDPCPCGSGLKFKKCCLQRKDG